MRKLATIDTIIELKPIADKIEVATVRGWEVVVKKGEFKVGDKIVYIEVDSIVPKDHPYFAFLLDRKYRVRTIKLRGQVSQGLVCPLRILPMQSKSIGYLLDPYGAYNVGDDVTEILGITKYDPQLKQEMEENISIPKSKIEKFFLKFKWYRDIVKRQKRSHGWPVFIKHTDEENLHNIPWVLIKENTTAFDFTEKLDGMSGTYFAHYIPKKWYQFKDPIEFGVCSRNLRCKRYPNSKYWQIADKYRIEKVLAELMNYNTKHIVLQGEICGPGVQKNKYNLPELCFFAFNLFIDDKQMNHSELVIKLDIPTVPYIGRRWLAPTVAEMVELSKGKSTLFNRNREGIVCRNYDKRISFKVKNPDFLIENEE